MVKETIITKQYINDNVRPFTPNDTLFSAAFFEVCQLDIKTLIGNTIIKELLDEDTTIEPTEDLKEALDSGLRKGLAYLTFARCVRTAQSVITKYGYVQKDAQEYSTRTDNNNIVADSNYFKKMGLDICKEYAYLNTDKDSPKVADSENNYNCFVIGF